MNLQINRTQDGLKEYPIHSHKSYEIMLYISGKGHLRTKNKNYPFSSGTIIIVPPDTEHGSTSKNGFKNISVCGDFDYLLNFSEPVVIADNEQQEGKVLAELIYNNRYENNRYLSTLCTTYIHYLLKNLKTEKNINICIRKIIDKISENAYMHDFNITELLLKSDYAEDYIRYNFKKITGKTPIEFLTEIRIKHARFLIEVYHQTLSLTQISELCGYLDYVYFSKKFKKITGMSPKAYSDYISGNKNIRYEK